MATANEDFKMIANDWVDYRRDAGVRRLMVWTSAREEKLLALWKSRRCLFDPNSAVSKSERQQAMIEVAAEMGITGSRMSFINHSPLQ